MRALLERRKTRFTSLILLILFLSLCFATLTPKAQTGEITGRVVTEDGKALPNAEIYLIPSAGNVRQLSRDSQYRTFTNEDGYFKFTRLAPIRYSIIVNDVKGYVRKPIPIAEGQGLIYHYAGDDVTITMIKGGAITGRVTNVAGEPLIGAHVTAVMVRDAEGMRSPGGGWQRATDDQGVYRIYGLTPGTYIVFTRNDVSAPYSTSGDVDVPTYHPSSTRDTAAEVAVLSGGEAGGIDIRHRGERGHVISGVVSGAAGAETAPEVLVTLYELPAGTVAASSFIQAGGARGFAFRGQPDGEYLITARTNNEESNQGSPPRRVTLRGGDITGLELKLLLLGSISGRIVVDSLPEGCGEKRKLRMEEFGVIATRDDSPRNVPVFMPWRSFSLPGANEKGEFTINSIDPGHYRIRIPLTDENLYVKGITSPANAPPRRGAPGAANNVSLNGLALKQGEKLSGVTVTVAEGAASLRGKVVAEKEGQRLPDRLRAHLVPTGPNATDEVLRYAESIVSSDSGFTFTNIAPGKYRLITRVAPNDEPVNRPATPTAWDSSERSKLRHEAMSAKYEIELQPCGRVKDYVLQFSH